jgi:hypothetical protein
MYEENQERGLSFRDFFGTFDDAFMFMIIDGNFYDDTQEKLSIFSVVSFSTGLQKYPEKFAIQCAKFVN